MECLKKTTGIGSFALLHIIGIHYIYSYVLYKEMVLSLGLIDKDRLHTLYNHYDRLYISYQLRYYLTSYIFVENE